MIMRRPCRQESEPSLILMPTLFHKSQKGWQQFQIILHLNESAVPLQIE
jgi:hypothetical protein